MKYFFLYNSIVTEKSYGRGSRMKSRKTTLQQIADAANVSIATVSRVLNNKDKVNPRTRDRILKTMEELDFQPRSSSMISDTTSRIILLCVPEFNNPFNAPVIEGIQNSAHTHGYDVLILQSRDYYTDTSDYTNILRSTPIAGIIILASVPNAELLSNLLTRFPVVMCSEHVEGNCTPYVSIDNRAAARKAVNYLISIGCRRIGLVNSNLSFHYAREREQGYLEALEASNLTVNPSWIAHISTVDYSLAISNALYILGQPNRPDAIFAVSDLYAISVIKAASKLGIRVPEDLSVIGFDNIDLATMATPAITTIDQPAFQIGFQSCELLMEKIENPSIEEKHILLETELVVRESTALPVHI